MRKTLLVAFIHGFKGGDDTFGNFPEHVRGVLSRALPAVKVVTAIYPKYETRGSLKDSVNVFRDWLQNQVIDLEVMNQTPSPTVDPSVHVFLVGHSMGGIVAAETLLLLASEQPISAGSMAADTSAPVESNSFMFPHIQGVFAFDTPFLGIAPGVVSHSAEGQYQNLASTYTAFSEVAGLFGLGGAGTSSKKETAATEAKKTLPPAVSDGGTTSDGDAAATPSWQRWGRYAMFAGAAGAVAAGGAAAMYSQRQRLTDGWSWVSSHLAFVGCLARPAELRQRLVQLANVQKDRGTSCVNFYTCLGNEASPLGENDANRGTTFSQKIPYQKRRTFCSLPFEDESQNNEDALEPGLRWIKALNDAATDEITAHTCMFLPKQNPGFHRVINSACAAMIKSMDKNWYATPSGPVDGTKTTTSRTIKGGAQNQSERGPVDGDDDDIVVVD